MSTRTITHAFKRRHAPLLAAGEVIPYNCDCALCDCDPTGRYVGMPIIAVGENKALGTHRCLHCGTTWTARKYRWQPAKVVSRVLRRAG